MLKINEDVVYCGEVGTFNEIGGSMKKFEEIKTEGYVTEVRFRTKDFSKDNPVLSYESHTVQLHDGETASEVAKKLRLLANAVENETTLPLGKWELITCPACGATLNGDPNGCECGFKGFL